MWEEQMILEDVTNATLLRRKADSGGPVYQNVIAQSDRPRIRPEQAGDEVEGRGLAAARGAKQGGQAVARLEAQVQLEARRVAESAIEAQLGHAPSRTLAGAAPLQPFGQPQRRRRDQDGHDHQPAALLQATWSVGLT